MAENPQEQVPQQTGQTVLNVDSFETDVAIQAFGQLININDSSILHEPTCLICSSKHRSEVEQIWTDKKTDKNVLKDIKKFLEERTSLPITKSIIENHMLYHFDREIKELQKKEYVDKIQRLTGENLTTLQRIRISLAAISERLTGINSIVPSELVSQIEVDRIKSAETARLILAQANILKLKNLIETDMRKTGELVTVPRQSFIDIFNTAIAEANTPSEKATINNILIKLTNLSSATQ